MTDYIFGVTHPQHWHSLNLHHHRKNYSFVGSLGSAPITMLQEKVGAGVYFNPYVEIDGMLIKYGVISIDVLCRDLLDWETLYLSGRMHKPVKIIRDDARVRLAQQVNLANALRTALLLLPKEFTEEELYLTIAGLSYRGDFRKYIGENPNKVQNIVSLQFDNFRLLYGELIRAFPNIELSGHHVLTQDDSLKARTKLLQKLPRLLKSKIKEEHQRQLVNQGVSIPLDDLDACKSIAASPYYMQYVNKGIHRIAFQPALTQSLKGILTGGLRKSGKYVGQKLSKWWKGY